MMHLLSALLVAALLVGSCGAQDHGPDENFIAMHTYRTFVGNPCVTLSDRGGPIGCRTPNGGVSGRLHRVTSVADVEAALQDVSVMPGGGVSLLVAPQAVQADVLRAAQKSDDVVGLLLETHTDQTRPAAFSPADVFPNQRFGLHADAASVAAWNPQGVGLLMSDTKKAWVSLGLEDTATIAAQLNASSTRGGVALGAEFTLQMMTITDTATCLRRNWCQPLGGYSVLAAVGGPPLPPLRKFNVNPQVVVVMASIDSASMFHTRSPGAVSDMSGVVALLGAFEALADWADTHTAQRPAVFHWFTGEAWGYIGSKSFVRRLYDGEAPYNASAVFALLEAKQVGTRGAQTLYAHSEPQAGTASTNGALAALLGAAGATKVDVKQSTSAWGLPPSSTMSFLLRGGLAIPHVVLTDHNAAYTNRYYHSEFDDLSNVDVELVCKAATVMANAVASLQQFSGAPGVLQANCTTVAELMSCLGGNWKCPLFKKYFPGWNMPEFAANYVGVYSGGTVTVPVKFVSDYAAERSSPLRHAPTSPCDRLGARCNNDTGMCIRFACVDLSNLWSEPAYPTGLYWADGWRVNDSAAATGLPVFTESNWNQLSVRTFVQEAPATQLAGLLVGGVLTVATAVACVVATRKFNAVWRLET